MCLRLIGNRISLTLILVFSLLSVCAAETFKNPGLISTSYDPSGVATGDFNHDGKLDLVYVDGASTLTLHLLLGRGNGKFSHGKDVVLPLGICGSTCWINVADVTNDGNLDIILGGSTANSGEVAVFPGNGDGTFQAAVISTIARHNGGNGGIPLFNTQMGVGDVNEDGAMDLVISDPASAAIYVLVGDNTGNFTQETFFIDYFTGRTVTYLTDLNGDGHLDIVVNDRVGAQTYVMLGRGDGTFKTAKVIVTYAILLADMDGDGHPDLVSTVYPGQIEVWKGNPDGTFASPSVVATVATTDFLIASGDFNKDGVQDLVFLTPAGVGILVGQGNLTFGNLIQSVAGMPVGFGTPELAQGDFDLDTNNDLAMGIYGGLLILAGKGDGTFVSADSYDVGQTVGTVAVADFNGDRHADIAASVSADYPRVLLGDGAGNFALAPDQNQTYGSQLPSGSMLSADFNGDGKNDLSVTEDTTAYQFGQPFILLGAGDGTFTTPSAIAAPPVLLGDLNNDGRSDMVTQIDGKIVAMMGQSNGSFTQVKTSLIHPDKGIAAIGDLNHDGKLDLLVYEYPFLRVWRGVGNGTFTESTLIGDVNQRIFATSVNIADVDGDGVSDVVVVQSPGEFGEITPMLIYYGNADGTFQSPVALPVSHQPIQLVVADVNQDNKPDFVVTDGNVISVMENLGGHAFGPELYFVAGEGITGLNVTDVNGDGYPDIVAANAGGTSVAVLLNEPNGNSIEGGPSNGAFTVSPEPALYSQPATLSITMSSPTGPVPSGSVSFGIDGSTVATVALAAGKASYTVNGVLITGSHTLVATYNGDNTYRAESFSVLHTVLAPVFSTSTVLVANHTTVFTSQTVHLKATVSSSVTVPAGTVTFMDGTNSLGIARIYQQPAVFIDTNLLAVGTHTLKAVYHGYQSPVDEQAIYEPSTSSAITVTVKSSATSTDLTASVASATAGTVVTFIANVSSSSGVPFGGATFYDGGTPLGTCSLLADGSCTFNTASLLVGAHSITVGYNANATFASSTSAASAVTITAAAASLSPTWVVLASTGGAGQTMIVAKVVASIGLPVGKVVFLDAGAVLGTVKTDGSGMAALPITTLASGTHHISASFRGGPQFAPAVSPDLLEQFPDGGEGFSMTVSGDSLDLTSSDSQTLEVSITPSAVRQTVDLTCDSGLPSGYECIFSPASLVAGPSQLRIERSTRRAQHSARGKMLTASLLLMVSLTLCLAGRGRKPSRALIALSACFLLLSGCGTPSGSLSGGEMLVLSIHATAGAGGPPAIHSAQILLRMPPTGS